MSQQIRSSQLPRTSSQESVEDCDINLNIDEQVNDLVRYIVVRAGEHMIFRRAELKKNILSKTGPNFQIIVEEATKILKNVYGYNVIVIDATHHSTKSYVVTNGLKPVEDQLQKLDDEYPNDVNNILLLLILSHIFMSNNYVSEVSLYSFLSSLKIDVDKRHEVFGNVKDYITNVLKSKKYINMEMDPISKKNIFSWGIRSEKEISKHDILKFVCKIYRDRQPTSWVNQYQIADQQQFENSKEGIDVQMEIE